MITHVSASQQWIMHSRPNPHARLRLFCFPYAGGGASLFRGWEDRLPSEVDVCAIQLPGRENRQKEPPFTRLASLVEALVEVLLPYLDVPFVVFGHSLGALIGFELAREFRRQNRSGLLHFFASGRKAPQIPRLEPAICELPDDEFIKEIRCFNGTPEAVLQNAELMRFYLPLLRADFSMYETYSYSPEAPLDCPITAFGGTRDCKVSRRDLMLWSDQTANTFALRLFQGDHFFVSSAQMALLKALSRELSSLLDTLQMKAYVMGTDLSRSVASSAKATGLGSDKSVPLRPFSHDHREPIYPH